MATASDTRMWRGGCIYWKPDSPRNVYVECIQESIETTSPKSPAYNIAVRDLPLGTNPTVVMGVTRILRTIDLS
jgi:hypothetical protein